MSTTQNVQVFQYKTAFKISMSKIVICMEFKSRLLLANYMAKKEKKNVGDGVRTRDPTYL